ncbi:hypothetical protein acsn021_06690 [Anaerocolumna cellulosilytica]|uniref:Uncharacterized protein n=1 Tax=Anaerocolumna cellulosilytica TaxID=433286 RepID=A0A6S6R1C1_9FIRM|nr:hypothetical protein acsn021_06690 [Anaerocolumna cellulosilytica]
MADWLFFIHILVYFAIYVVFVIQFHPLLIPSRPFLWKISFLLTVNNVSLVLLII